MHTHLTSPLSRGLFQKAIIESDGGRDGVLTGRPMREGRPNEPAETTGVNFARRHGIQKTDADALARLRALSAAEIVDGGQETAGPNGPVIYSGPILDGRLTVETPQSAYEAGRQMRVPLIIGSNSADFVGFRDERRCGTLGLLDHALLALDRYTEFPLILCDAVESDLVQQPDGRPLLRTSEDARHTAYS